MRAGDSAALSPETFKAVFSRLASGVAVIGFDREGRKHGFTATSLTPVSVEPPMALFCVGNGNESRGHLKLHTSVGISILSKAQSELSNRFAGKAASDRYAGVATVEHASGVSLLSGAIACMEGTIARLIPAGDHTIYLCQVSWAHAEPEGTPLLYFSRQYHQLASLPQVDAQRPQLQRRELTTRSLVAVIASSAPSVRAAAAIKYTYRRAGEIAPGLQTDILNLHEMPLPLCDGRKLTDVASVARAVEKFAAASSVLLATPIYRGTYSAALKNLLDWLPLESLEGKRVGLIASGSTPHHYLMIDMALRPLLAWFNATLIPGSVYLTKDDILHDGPSETTAANLDALAQALVAEAPPASAAGPPALLRQLSPKLIARAPQTTLTVETRAPAPRSHWLGRLTGRSSRG
jgi:flavin reductase (DIM6/NTAB) family NADH-FMN oxidoreductase RutF/NAD(P)H-dependent FMN reductase